MTTQSTPDAHREALIERLRGHSMALSAYARYDPARSCGMTNADAVSYGELIGLAATALSAPPVSREGQQDQGVTADAAALAGQEPLSPSVSALRAPDANAGEPWFCERGDFWGTAKQICLCAKCGKRSGKGPHKPLHITNMFKPNMHMLCDECYDSLPDEDPPASAIEAPEGSDEKSSLKGKVEER